MGMTSNDRIEQIQSHARQMEVALEAFILRLPTGAARNACTDANIHLMAARQAMRNAAAILECRPQDVIPLDGC